MIGLSRFNNLAQSGELASYLTGHYGSGQPLLRDRLRRYRKLTSFALERWGDREILPIRVPARVNLMGVHVDHRGGFCNYVTFARETLVLAAPRGDSKVCAYNVDAQYPDVEFSIEEELPEHRRGDWMRFINDLSLEKGHWGNYLKAGALKIQDAYPERNLCGFDLCLYGDVPPGAGLSSSSTLVVGTMMAANSLNDLGLSPADLVPLCAEGEWLVGTRGGAGDHGAMLLGRRGRVVHIRFFPMRYRYAPLPEGYSVVVCHSRVEAQKSAGAREVFNRRIAGYALGLLWIKEKFPEYADRLEHLRDIHPETLDTDEARIYEVLQAVPVEITAEALLSQLSGQKDEAERVFETFGKSREPYPLRETVLFGVAECRRSEVFADLLDSGDTETLGALMFVSHNGDRVSSTMNEDAEPYRSPFDDAYLQRLIADRRSGDPRRMETAALHFQPGGYRCSVPDVDRMVDICARVDGVVGAGLTGAGLGGCIVVLVRTNGVEDLQKTLVREYYEPLRREPFIEICVSVSGADTIEAE